MRGALLAIIVLCTLVAGDALAACTHPNCQIDPPAGRMELSADYSGLECSTSAPYVTNGTTVFPTTPCNNPNGMIAIDPTRFGLSGNLGGRPDANGSMYGVDVGSGTCTGVGAAIGCVDSATDFVSFLGQSASAMTLDLGATPGSKNSLTLVVASGDTSDPFFCRKTSAPYDTPTPAVDCVGAAAGCGFATPGSSYPETYIVRAQVADDVCAGNGSPFAGCTGSGTGNVYRYYPVTVTNGNMCSSTGTSLTVIDTLPATFESGDSMMAYTADGTHTTAYGHAWLAQTIQEATFEEHFVPRVNLMPDGALESTTANGTDANCIVGSATTSWSFVAAGGAWLTSSATLDPTNAYTARNAIYGEGCYAVNANTSAGSYAQSAVIPVVAGDVYTIVGMTQLTTASTPVMAIQLVDSGGTVIDPTSARTVWNAWSPRSNADKDPLTYNATGLGAAPSLDGAAGEHVVWAPVVIKVRAPAGVTGIRVRIGRGANASNIFLDEWYAYRSLHQDLSLHRIFPEGLQDWALTGDSRNISSTYGIDSSHPGTFGMLDYATENGYGMRPLITYWPFSKLYPSSVDAAGGRRVSDEMALTPPYPLFKSRRPQFAFVALGLNDVNGGSQTPAAIENNIVRSREAIASYGSIPVWILEAPWKGTVGTAAGAQACDVDTAAPDKAGRADNCGAAIMSLNRRILHNGIAW